MTTSRVLTSEEFVRKLEEKTSEEEKRKLEVAKRKKEREERKQLKMEEKKNKTSGKRPAVKKVQEQPEVEEDTELCECCKRREPEGEEEDVEWVECDTCEKWFHVICLGVTDIAELGDSYFVCANCCE